MRSLMLCLLPAIALANDPYEPNDTPQIPPSGLNAHYQVINSSPQIIDGLVAEAGGEDWFIMYGDCCMPVAAAIRTPNRRVQIALFDEQGTPLLPSNPDVSRASMGPWRGLQVRDAGGFYYIRVRNTGAVDVDYSLAMRSWVYVN